MNLSNDALFYSIVGIAVLAAARLYYVMYKDAHEIKEEPKQPHEVRKVTFTKGVDPYETEKPKRKKKKYYNNKKKKPAVAESAPIAKRPVGRPRKTTE
jgi:hypothetical protein